MEQLKKGRLKMEVDKKGLEFFKKEEGVVNYVYKDSKGLDTFGIGHLLVLPKDNYLYNYTKENPAPDALVESVFKTDLKRFENRVNKELAERGLKVNQNQFNALVSFAFNVGEGGFMKSFLLRDLKTILEKNDMDLAKNRFLSWSSGGMLKNRRMSEFRLFSSTPIKTTSKNNSGAKLGIIAFFGITLYLLLK